MLVRVDPKADTPVYQQIVDQIKAGIARGACRVGDMIPSVRQLAADVLVNPNTVARAYLELEHDGVVSARRGIGLVVTVVAPGQCQADRRRDLARRLLELVAEARRAGIAGMELRMALEHELAAQAPEPVEPACEPDLMEDASFDPECDPGLMAEASSAPECDPGLIEEAPSDPEEMVWMQEGEVQ